MPTVVTHSETSYFYGQVFQVQSISRVIASVDKIAECVDSFAKRISYGQVGLFRCFFPDERFCISAEVECSLAGSQEELSPLYETWLCKQAGESQEDSSAVYKELDTTYTVIFPLINKKLSYRTSVKVHVQIPSHSEEVANEIKNSFLRRVQELREVGCAFILENGQELKNDEVVKIRPQVHAIREELESWLENG